MKKKTIIAVLLFAGIATYITACYNNKKDILLPDNTVSFTKQVVPIFNSGPCGCHNQAIATTVVIPPANIARTPLKFSNGGFGGVDTVLYDVILSRASSDAVKNWAEGKAMHPGGGGTDVFLTPLQSSLILAWVKQGAIDDRNSGGPVITNPTFSRDINTIVSSTCNGSSCHGGVGPTLTYSKLTSDQSILGTMAASKGASGHPGGRLTLPASVCLTFQTWIANGMPQ